MTQEHLGPNLRSLGAPAKESPLVAQNKTLIYSPMVEVPLQPLLNIDVRNVIIVVVVLEVVVKIKYNNKESRKPDIEK